MSKEDSEIKDFPLGTRVKILGSLQKKHRDDPRGRGFETFYEPDGGVPSYTTGIIYGKRTFQTGFTGYAYDGRCFRANGGVQAYLVAFHLRCKPIICLPEQITELPSPVTTAWAEGFDAGYSWACAIEKGDPDTPQPTNPYLIDPPELLLDSENEGDS